MKLPRRMDGRTHQFHQRRWGMLVAGLAVVFLGIGAPAHAGNLVIVPTFDSSITNDPNAAAIEAAINSAIGVFESDLTTQTPVTVTIYFQEMSSGLGESSTYINTISYYQYYNALAAHATTSAQLTALASLGSPPTSTSSPNPVNGNTQVLLTTADLRTLGFTGPGTLPPSSNPFDSTISLNTSITSPPNTLNGSTYSLRSVAMHEIDEALGVGGSGSTLTGTGSLTGPVGVLDLFRYSAPGVRSYTNQNSTSPLAYFSIDGGNTVLSYFNQTNGADFGDWLSNPIPPGFAPQVQDAFGSPGTNPTLGPNELLALTAAAGYTPQVTVPEPSSLVLLGTAVLILSRCGWRRHTPRTGPMGA
ncbi:MAG TPA: NF038122 family metalloprotease [Isosphaeraceae bacterium]|nr:NF038122 family metalloprotease [Isosphaeraceae bacterium]